MSTYTTRIKNHTGELDWICQLGELDATIRVWYRFDEGEPATDDTPAGDHEIIFRWARIESMNDEPRPKWNSYADWFAMCFVESRQDEVKEMIAAKVLGY